ncbi:MAG: hypothetical protein L6Q84_03155 [Polyangiaceae bacterium]|nr:hypothetical protein [Polyangiaceae bacterium]
MKRVILISSALALTLGCERASEQTNTLTELPAQGLAAKSEKPPIKPDKLGAVDLAAKGGVTIPVAPGNLAGKSEDPPKEKPEKPPEKPTKLVGGQALASKHVEKPPIKPDKLNSVSVKGAATGVNLAGSKTPGAMPPKPQM